MSSAPGKEEKAADIRQLLFHVNNVFHTRVNLLLVAESIFFAAIAALWKDGDKSLKMIVCGLGVVMTLMLWFSNATLYKRSNYLSGELKKVDALYKEYLEVVSLKYITVTGMLTHALSFILLLAWVLVILVVIGVI